MASNQNESDQPNQQDEASSPHEGSTPEHGQSQAAAKPSQALPLITEELAATHAAADRSESTPTTTSCVTTPVMPPNPVRREEAPQSSAARMMQAEAAGNSPSQESAAAGIPTAVSPAAVDEDKDEKKTKSEGRISATQLLAGAGAAATSSVIGGQLGVAGTVVGAGVASIVTGLAVTLYSRSLDKGKEKIKEVGSKLAPAVKGKPLAGKTDGLSSPIRDGQTGTFGTPTDGIGGSADSAAAAVSADSPGSEPTADKDEQPTSWWQQLRRKRVLYPLTIGVAAFGIGLGGVVMAESFTDADISPGTSQISRSVSGQSSTGEDPGTGTSDSGTSGEGSAGGSGSGPDGSQGSTDSGSGGQNAQSTSAGESGSQGTDTGQSDQGTDSTTNNGTDTGSTTAEGTDTSSDATGSDGTESTGGGGDSSGGADGSSSTGGGSGSGSSGTGGGSAGAGTGGSAGGSSGGSGTSAQG